MKTYLLVLAISIQALLGAATNKDVEKRIDEIIEIFENEENIYIMPDSVKVKLDDLLVNSPTLVSDREAIKQLMPKFQKLAVYLARCCTIKFIELRDDFLVQLDIFVEKFNQYVERITSAIKDTNTMMVDTLKNGLVDGSEVAVRRINDVQDAWGMSTFAVLWTDFSVGTIIGSLTGTNNVPLKDIFDTFLIKLWGFRWLQDLTIKFTGDVVCLIRKLFSDAKIADIEIH